MNLYEKMVEIKKVIAEDGLHKNKKSFNYSYVTGDQILAKIVNKMNELKLLLVPSSTVGEYEQYNYKNSKGADKTDFLVKGEMSYTWINAENPEEQFTSSWAYYGQQEDVSKAYGSGLTYSERYYLLKFFGVPTDQDDPDGRNNKGGDNNPNYNNNQNRNRNTQNRGAGNQQNFKCSGCDENINQAVKTFSENKYGKALCMDCQKKQGK